MSSCTNILTVNQARQARACCPMLRIARRRSSSIFCSYLEVDIPRFTSRHCVDSFYRRAWVPRRCSQVPLGLSQAASSRGQIYVDRLYRCVLPHELCTNFRLIHIYSGSWVLSATGLLDGRRATTNKSWFRKIAEATTTHNIQWVPKARWVVDGKFWTASGVSAGEPLAILALYHRSLPPVICRRLLTSPPPSNLGTPSECDT